MILARLSRAVREQNWFAVAIEFVIVIAGVVIGFQISAWNEARQERAAERDTRCSRDRLEQIAALMSNLDEIQTRIDDRLEAIGETH